jgi:3-hydroxyisobutyrate dehydrogenase-like beta-hydroxyacid dehydrogenase
VPNTGQLNAYLSCRIFGRRNSTKIWAICWKFEVMSGFNIGWIGVGKMGTPMCRNLLRASYPVFACDIDATRLAAIVTDGAMALARPAEIAERSDIVISMVPNDQVLLSVVEGPAGLAGSMARGKIFVDLSTVSPAASARVAAALESTGCLYLRAPVSGSTTLAEKGALSMYCSGPREAFERCEPILAKLSARQTYVGSSEEARVLKLLINLIVEITPVVLGEALAFGLKGGLERAQIIDAIGQSVAASPLLGYKAEMIKARDWSPMATIDLVAKDLDLAIDFGRLNNISMPLTTLVRQYYAAFQASGDGLLDFFSVVTWPERMLAKTE